MGLKPCARASEEHRERARKLRELANVAPSRSEQAQLNARAEMFDAFARLREQPATSEQFYRFTSSMGAVSYGLGTAAQVARHRDRLDPTHPHAPFTRVGGLGSHRGRAELVGLDVHRGGSAIRVIVRPTVRTRRSHRLSERRVRVSSVLRM